MAVTNLGRCATHNFDLTSTTPTCPCCAQVAARPVVTEHAVAARPQQVDIALPLTPGCIVDEQVRQIVYEGIRSDVTTFLRKWGFTDFNIQLKWPDTDNHPTIEFFSAGLGYYKRFLGSMIDKCGTLSPAAKLRFIQALVQALDRLGYFQELQTIMTSYQFQRTAPAREDEPQDEDQD